MSEYIPITCPFLITPKGSTELKKCNRLCVRVAPGSSGETWCRNCRKPFEFDVRGEQVKNIKVVAKSV